MSSWNLCKGKLNLEEFYKGEMKFEWNNETINSRST